MEKYLGDAPIRFPPFTPGKLKKLKMARSFNVSLKINTKVAALLLVLALYGLWYKLLKA